MIEVYADGSSGGRTAGACGWGWVVCRNLEVVAGGYGGAPTGTNNIAEMQGAIDGLTWVLNSDLRARGEPVVLISDSQYTLGMASGCYHPSKNLELVAHLRGLMAQFGAGTRWVRGHSIKTSGEMMDNPRDVLLNERCDHLAKQGKDEHTPEKVLKKRLAKKAKATASKFSL